MRILLLVLSITGSVCRADETAASAVEDRLEGLVREARSLLTQGRDRLAERKLDQAFAIMNEQLPDHPGWTSSLLHVFGEVLAARGDAAQAAKVQVASTGYLMRAVPRDKYPLGHPVLVVSLQSSAIACSNANQKIAARRFSEAALTMAKRLYTKKRFPNGHPDLAECFNAHGVLMMEAGNLKQARICLSAAVEIHGAHLNHPRGRRRYAIALSNLGRLEHLSGRFAESDRQYQQSERQWSQIYTPSSHPQGHADLARLLGNRGSLENARGDYTRALEFHRRATRMFERHHRAHAARGHADVARSLHNVAVNLEQLGQYSDAEKLLVVAKSMFSRVLQQKLRHALDAEFAWCCETLARVRRARGKLEEAAANYQLSLTLRERLYPRTEYPRGHPELSRAMDSFGMLLKTLKRFEQAESFVRRAVTMNRRLYPTDQFPHGHPELARSLNNLGTLLDAAGKHNDALPFYRESLAMLRKLYQRPVSCLAHEEIARAHGNLGRALVHCSQDEEAIAHLDAAVRTFRQISQAFGGELPEAQAIKYANALPKLQADLIGAWLRTGRSTESLYQRVWQTRGSRMRMLSQRRARLAQSTDSASAQILSEFLQLRRILSARYRPRDVVSLKSQADIDRRNQHLLGLQRRMEALERELIARIPGWRRANIAEQTAAFDPKTLPSKTALVDFYVFHDRAGKTHLGAFVLQNAQAPRWVSLGPAKTVDRTVRAWREVLMKFKTKRNQLTESFRRDLRRQVWDPIDKQLAAATELVYLVPERSLWFVPWYALPGRNAKGYLIEDLTIGIVPGGPWLVKRLRQSRKSNSSSRLLAVGGLDYVRSPIRRKASFAVKKSEWKKENADASKYVRPKRESFLPGSVVESRYAIHSASAYPTALMTGREATREDVLVALPQARWAVLATHGIYSSPAANRTVVGQTTQGSGPSSRDVDTAGLRNPLLRSSLSLSGSSHLFASRTAGGFVTALDLADLSLPDLDVAFLSACQTALGDLEEGEGVHGLRQALHQAGTRTVVSNLWSVDDRSTMKIMMLTYDLIFREKKSPLVATREAQLAMIRSPAELMAWDGTKPFRPKSPGATRVGKAPAIHEFFWAPIIVSGVGR